MTRGVSPGIGVLCAVALREREAAERGPKLAQITSPDGMYQTVRALSEGLLDLFSGLREGGWSRKRKHWRIDAEGLVLGRSADGDASGSLR
jgi:hypothetical protein